MTTITIGNPLISFDALHDSFRQRIAALAVDKSKNLNTLEKAIDGNAFKSRVFYEPMYSLEGIMAHEALSRPHTEGRQQSMQPIANEVYALGLGIQLDVLTTTNSVRQAKSFPISVNISVESALSPEFWNETMQRIAKYNPADIIFEILEHDVDPKADILYLQSVKSMGYRFALDDYKIGEDHSRRLAVFGGLVDFIKIEGVFLNDMFFNDPDILKTFVKQIKVLYPQMKVIGEHVRSFDQAQILFAMGFDAVQGRALREQDFRLF